MYGLSIRRSIRFKILHEVKSMEEDSYNGEQQAPHGIYLHLYGIITTIAGMPVDLGLPSGINIDDLIRRQLV